MMCKCKWTSIVINITQIYFVQMFQPWQDLDNSFHFVCSTFKYRFAAALVLIIYKHCLTYIYVLAFVFSLFCRTKALVLELLAAVCLVRGGHEIILSAFDNFKEVWGAWREGRWGLRRMNMSLHFNCVVSNGDSVCRNASSADVRPADCCQG